MTFSAYLTSSDVARAILTPLKRAREMTMALERLVTTIKHETETCRMAMYNSRLTTVSRLQSRWSERQLKWSTQHDRIRLMIMLK